VIVAIGPSIRSSAGSSGSEAVAWAGVGICNGPCGDRKAFDKAFK
jgi:hypothetical protein